MIRAFYSALTGINNYLKRFNQCAHNIARVGDFRPKDKQKPVDLPKEMVDMMIAEKGIKANLKTVETADEILGSLLDTKS
jgi:flagellar hook protein FlgE